MRLLIGAGAPREAAARALACLVFVHIEDAVGVILVAESRDRSAVLVMVITAETA